MPANKQKRSSLKSLKQKNRHDVLEFLRNSREPLSILDISRKTALSKMTVHKILGHYVASDLAVSVGKGDSGEDGGKRPTLFAFNHSYRFIFSMKITETALLAAATNLKAQVMAKKTAVFDRETGLADILRLIRNLLHELAEALSLRPEDCVGIVVGCHGITNSEAGIIVTSPHFASWGSDIPIRSRIKEMFQFDVPVYIDNWVRYFAYGEMKRRVTPARNFMVIGTEPEGIAAGLVMDGVLTTGANGLAGEIGHMIVNPASPEICVCGGIGCLEVAMSLTRMEQRAWSRRSDWPESLLFRNQDKPFAFPKIFEAANAGDAFACMLIDDAIRYCAIGVNNIIQACDPGLIIIQGEYAKAGDYFIKQLRDRLARMSLLRMNKNIKVEYSEHGDDWTLSGGAHYAADMYFSKLVV